MSDSNEFEGCIQLNGKVQSNRVKVFTTGFEIVISDANGKGIHTKTLYLHPFNTHMLRSAISADMKNGIYYSIMGTKVGAYNEGPLGHPGDGEYDSRPIKEFMVRSKYTSAALSIEIEGSTEAGTSGFSQYGPQYKNPLPPWKFHVLFRVPRAEMKSFFKFTDFNYPFFEKLLDECS